MNLLARLRCSLSASHDTRTAGNVTTCARGCGFRYERPGRRPSVNLTPGQRRAVAAIALLGNTRHAARALGISGNTLRTHVQAAHKKAGSHTILELADALGWLFVPDKDIASVLGATFDAGEAERVRARAERHHRIAGDAA